MWPLSQNRFPFPDLDDLKVLRKEVKCKLYNNNNNNTRHGVAYFHVVELSIINNAYILEGIFSQWLRCERPQLPNFLGVSYYYCY